MGSTWLQALASYKEALIQNPQSTEVAIKIKRLTQLVREKKRAQDKQPVKTNGSSPASEPEPVKVDVVL